MKRCRERHSSNLKQSLVQNQFTKIRIRPLSGLVLMGLLATTAQAGKITSELSASGAIGFGGWNEGNVTVIVNGTGSTYDPNNGSYFFAEDSDNSYIANVDDGAGTVTGIALAKDWPVGEPPGIKVINDDPGVKAPKPANCIMATSYLADHYLDSADPQQVLCSGPFQSHKRYKLAMLPSTVDGVGSDAIDLVFNVEAEAGSRQYQIFQKINNWTDGRLEGFRVQVGVGVGAGFKTASAVNADLTISVPTEIWAADQLAVFSAGLFGPLDKHTGNVGFFDPDTRAGFLIDEYGSTTPTDTLTATTTLGSDYAEVPAGATNQFGPWVANNMLPYGVFFDDDGNPETDAELLAWYGYNPAIDALGWMGGSQDNFAEVTAAEIGAMGENLAYTMDVIDDLVNVGLSYIVTVGDVSTFGDDTIANNGTFTIRVIPTKDTSGAPNPPYVGATPDPELVFTSSDAAVLLDPNPEFVVGSLLTARVGDADLNTDPAVAETVDVTIATTGLSATLTLVEQGENRGVFVATLPEEYSLVTIGTDVTLSYVDADTGTATNVTKTSTSTAVEALPETAVTITEIDFPATVTDRSRTELEVEVANAGPDAATGSVLVTGSDGSEFSAEFTDLAAGADEDFEFKWRARLDDSKVAETVTWVISVTIDGVIVADDSALTVIEPRVRGRDRDDDDRDGDRDDDDRDDD